MSALLPAFLAVPIALMVLFELGLVDQIESLTQPDDDGNISSIGRAILYVRNRATNTLDKGGAHQAAHGRGSPTVVTATQTGSRDANEPAVVLRRKREESTAASAKESDKKAKI